MARMDGISFSLSLYLLAAFCVHLIIAYPESPQVLKQGGDEAVIFLVSRDQIIYFALYRRYHLNRVFKIVIIKVERLFDRALFDESDFNELQQVGNSSFFALISL
jgi:hypothetical protein